MQEGEESLQKAEALLSQAVGMDDPEEAFAALEKAGNIIIEVLQRQ